MSSLRQKRFTSATDARLLWAAALLSIMINTYQTSLAPPPVPPRLSRDHPVLIPQTLAPQGHRKPFLSLLACVVLLHFFLSIAGFIYLYSNKKLVRKGAEKRNELGLVLTWNVWCSVFISTALATITSSF